MEPDSSFSSTHYAPSQPGSVVWFISFGDLLTLLLCFFLVLTPWEKLRATGNVKVKQEVASASHRDAQVGTVFASTDPQGQPAIMAEIPIYAEHVSGESLSGLVSLANALQQEVAPAVERAHSITVTLCDSNIERVRALANIGRLTQEFDRQGVGVGIEVASDCDRIEILRPTTGRVVGVISVRGA
jgi:hypothetical protein